MARLVSALTWLAASLVLLPAPGVLLFALIHFFGGAAR
jgi:hypothetical protein